MNITGDRFQITDHHPPFTDLITIYHSPVTTNHSTTNRGGLAIRFCVLASGSKGNAVWIEADGMAVLVDSGLSAKQLKKRIALAGLNQNRLKAILVSHEHRDHVSGVGVLARMLKLPVYLNEGAYHRSTHFLDKVSPHFFTTGNPFSLGPLYVHPFSTSHDTVDPVGFTFEHLGEKMGLATDLGVATALVRDHLQGCRALILEANHDPDMLVNGPYPWDLKQRVRGRQGHLSNFDAADLITQLSHPGLESVVLAHLSEVNNLPQKALETVASALSNPGFSLTAACQDKPTGIFDLESKK